MSDTKTITRGDQTFIMKISPDEYVTRRYRVHMTMGSESTIVAYCALKPAKNNFARGYRITNYSIIGSELKGLGLGQEMIDFFEEFTGKQVIPSGVFGATGQLTKLGKAAAGKRLERKSPKWLPADWKDEFEKSPILEGLIAVPEHMFRDAMQNFASHVLSWALTKTKKKAQEKEVWRLAEKYDCELWHEYTIDSPVKVDHLKLNFSDIPEHYPEKHHDDVYTAVDWRPNGTAAAWHKSKKVILVYPMAGPRPDLMYWPDREHALEDYLDEVEISVRHELRHAIQTILLPDAQNTHTYIDAVKDPVSYATSPNEFDPTIGTLADNFVSYYRALIGYGKKPDVPKMIRQAVGMLPPNIGEKPDKFFTILRKEDPTKYRLAVKKFSAEVMRLIKL